MSEKETQDRENQRETGSHWVSCTAWDGNLHCMLN